jgi:hypothetical protein
MATQAIDISAEQQAAFEQAAQDFVNQVLARYPKITSIQPMDKVIEATLASMKDIGIYRSGLSVKAFWAGFNNAVQIDRTIRLPKEEPVLTAETIEKLKASFPPVVKHVERQLTQKEKSALAGISNQTGRVSHVDRSNTKAVEDIYQAGRNAARLRALRQEYSDLKNRAETLRGDDARNHAQAARVRKAALDKINADPKFKEVRD